MQATAPQAFDTRLLNAGANLLFALAALAFLGLALSWLVRLPLFTLRGILIEGEVAHNSATTIRANAAPKLAGNFFTMDLARSQQAFESVPWVRRAVVRRVWPNRLAVALEEHKAAAYWHREDRDDELVNSYGEVFDANLGDVEDESLPTLKGPEGSAGAMLDFYRRLLPVFGRLGARVEALTLSTRGSWDAELDSGAEIELGRGTPDELLARAESFAGTVTQVTSRYQRPLEYADLRHASGYAVKLRGVSTGAAADKQTKGARP
ncbi:MAG TPA: cell division protein FtsQ/DivIB [Methylibium sp.]